MKYYFSNENTDWDSAIRMHILNELHHAKKNILFVSSIQFIIMWILDAILQLCVHVISMLYLYVLTIDILNFTCVCMCA